MKEKLLRDEVVCTRITELERQLAEVQEALHEIYSKACQAMNNDDDLYLYGFAQDARDISLKAVKAQENSDG